MAKQDRNVKLSSTVLWRIENFSSWVPKIHSSRFVSPQFRFKKPLNFCGTLEMPIDSDKPNSSILIYFKSENFPYSVMDLEWSILDGDGLPILTKVYKYTNYHFGERLFSMPNSPTYADVLKNRKSSFLPNGIFSMQLRITQVGPNSDLISLNSGSNSDNSEHISVVTRIEALEESFVWRIEKFANLQLDEEIVTSVKLGEAVFSLIFSLNGASLDDADVNFLVGSENAPQQRLNVKLSFLDKDENETMGVQEIKEFSSLIREHIYGLSEFVSRREILERKSDLLHDENLTVLCKFTSDLKYNVHKYIEGYYCGPPKLKSVSKRNFNNVTKETESNPRTIVSTISKRNIQSSLQSWNELDTSEHSSLPSTIDGEEFLSVYNEQILSDFELRSGDVTFPVHKIFLAARSPVFKTMFCGDMKESDSKSMDIPDLDVHTLGRMLTFIYGGKADDLQWESAAKLYYAADKYEILALKQSCSTVLQSNITVSNVSDILELADRHQDQELTSHVHNFIQEHLKEILISEEWDKFLERSYLAGKTMKEVLIKSNSII